MDGSAECAPFVSGVSLHYADTFSRCGHFFGAHAVPKLSSSGINDSRAAHAIRPTNSSFCASWPPNCGQAKERVACLLQFLGKFRTERILGIRPRLYFHEVSSHTPVSKLSEPFGLVAESPG